MKPRSAWLTSAVLGSSLYFGCSQGQPQPPVQGAAGRTAEAGKSAAGAPAPAAGSPAAAGSTGAAGVAGLAAVSGKAGAGAPAPGGASGAAGKAGAPAAGSGGVAPAPSGPSSVEGTASSAGGVLKAQIEVKQVAPGQEAHECVVVELPNTQPVWVNELRGRLSDGSHHLIVDRRTASDTITTKSVECSPTMAGDQTRLLIAQQHDTQLKLPSGVAYKLDARQRIFLQLHYINLKEQPAVITGSVELTPLAAGATPKEARSLFAGATSISLAPRQAGMASFFAKPSSNTGTRRVFAVTSHTHRLGIRSTIERVASMTAPESTPIHESLDWAEPPLSVFNLTLDFTGKDGLRLICRYMNTTDQPVGFGTSAEDEMCFMWMYYYDE